MWDLLPIAGISINTFVLVSVGIAVGFLAGLLGVGGGVLLTPLLMMIGIRPTVAAASGSNAIVATSSSGMAAHFRLGNVDIKLGSVLLLGGLFGAALGVDIIRILQALGEANFAITITYVVVLAGIGGFMLIDGVNSLHRGGMMPEAHRQDVRPGIFNRLPWQMNFPCSGVRHSVLVPFVLCVFVGILTAIMGVGGGFLIVPIMVYVLRVPMRVAVGTSLFQILFNCAGVTYLQAVENHTVDIEVAVILALGSTVGAQIGARVSRGLRAEHLKILMAALALAVMVKMGADLMIAPSNLLSHVRAH